MGRRSSIAPRAPRIAAADADDNERLGAGADLVGDGDYALELGALYEPGQLQPAGKICTLASLLAEHPVRRSGGGKVGPRRLKKRFATGEVELLIMFLSPCPLECGNNLPK